MNRLLVTALCALLFSVHIGAAHPGGTVHADVNGLVCDFCARALEKMFKREDAVESIEVNLDTKVISIHFHEGKQLDDETIISVINDAGYDVRALRHDE